MKRRMHAALFLCMVFAGLFIISVLLVAALRWKEGATDSREAQADTDEAEMTVVASFYPMYVAALNLTDGVEGISLSCLSEPQTGCLHDYQLVPEDMEFLSTADVFVINGGGMESFLGDVTAEYPSLRVVDTSETIVGELAHLELAAEDADNGEDAEVNAHFWMSIPLYEKQVSAMADGLCAAAEEKYKDAEAKAYLRAIRANESAYMEQLDALLDEEKSIASAWQDAPVILFHEAYAYVAGDYGMAVRGLMDLDEERQIGASEVAAVTMTVRESEGCVILAEELYGKAMAETIRGETPVDVIYLDTIVRADDEGDKDAYIRRMRENIRLLANAK